MNIQDIKLKRALWLAFEASAPVGMGFLHSRAADAQTEDSLFAELADARIENSLFTDYVFGRMMKTKFTCTPSGELSIWPEKPRRDYQSWCSTYPTAADLVAAVERSLSVTP